MEYAEKIGIADYLIGEKCLCGAAKKSKRWACKPCVAAHEKGGQLAQHLELACSLHLSLGKQFAEECLSRRGTCPVNKKDQVAHEEFA